MADRAVSQEERVTARTGAMRSAWMVKDYQEIISVASGLIAESKLAPELANEAHYYRAKLFLPKDRIKKQQATWLFWQKIPVMYMELKLNICWLNFILTMEKQERQRKRYLII